MNYRRLLLFRWSTRDVLAILSLAVIVAFLTGGVLFYTAAKDKPTEIAQEFRPAGVVSEYASVEDARQATDEDEILFRYAAVEGTDRLLVGVGQADRSRARGWGLELPETPDSGVGTAMAQSDESLTVRTGDGTETVSVTALEDSRLFPERWYVSNPSLVERLGPSGALVISPPDDAGTGVTGDERRSSTVVRGTLLFFEQGTDQVLRGFVLVVVAAGILGAVTIASVIQMTVRDRKRAIQVIRATGATRASVVALFGTRGVLLTGVAVAVGYAFGTVASSVVTSVAVFAGLPTTVSPRLTAEGVRLLASIYAPLLVVGFATAAVTVVPVVRRPPGQLTRQATGDDRLGWTAGRIAEYIPAVLRPETRLLDWRAVVPTVATVTVFVAIVLLVTAGASVAQPLTGDASSTVLEPDAAHPVASSIPASYASALAAQNVSASPEILVFGVVNDEPTIVRGGKYDSFAAVSNAQMLRGRPMANETDAVVGVDVARRHGIEVGETVVVGGGTERTVERVDIVGVYRATGSYDDQVLVSLPTARRLSAVRAGNVNFVRTSDDVGEPEREQSVRVVATNVEGQPTTEGVSVTLTVANVAETNRTRNVSVSLGNQTVTERVRASPDERTQVTAQFTPREPGTYTLSAGGLSRQVDVLEPDALILSGVPSEAPPRSGPLVRVTTAAGESVSNATVTVGNRTVGTDDRGYIRLPLAASGTREIRVSHDSTTVTEQIEVTDDASRDLTTSLVVSESVVSEFSRPTARLRLYNPWNATDTGTLTIRGPESRTQVSYRLDSGETATYETTLAPLPAGEGEYTVTAERNGTRIADTSYRVTGNDRLSTVVIRNTETTAGGGIGAAIAIVFGNLTVVVAALVALAGLMVSGALITSFARTIHARRRTLGVYRATGASPGQVVLTVLRDTLLVGSVSVVVGVGLGVLALTALDAFDLLVFYGIRVAPSFGPRTLVGVGAVAMGLVVVGALVPTVAVLRQPPAESFTDIERPASDRNHE